MEGITAYQDNAVSTQSKGRLIAMLYDSAIKFMILAIMEMEKKNDKAKDRYINKALDMDAGGKIARNLRKQYIFMSNRLSQANIKSDPQMICDVIKLMEELNKIWKAIS